MAAMAAHRREPAPARAELAAMAFAGLFSPDLMLEHVFDRIEEGAK